MPTENELRTRLEEEVAAASMSIHRVDFLCPVCGQWHGCPGPVFSSVPFPGNSAEELSTLTG